MKLNSTIASIVSLVSGQQGLDPYLVAAIVMQESGGDTWATRTEQFWKYYADPRTGEPAMRQAIRGIGKCSDETERMCQQMSWGILQVMGSVARERGFRGQFLSELCDPIVGVTYGARHLKKKIDRYDLDSAISAYNAGSPTEANRMTYTEPVLAFMADFKEKGF